MRHCTARHHRLTPRCLWLRWLVWVLAVSIPLQATAATVASMLEPAHFHSPRPGTTTDPMLDMVRLVHDHHSSSPHHQHGQVERHHHDVDADVGEVTLVGDGEAETHTAQNSDGKRAAGDQPASVDTPVPAAADRTGTAHPVERSCHFRSHIGGLLERPPR